MTQAIDEAALKQLFLDARTHNKWQQKDVPDALLHRLVDVLKMGPTSANCSPARFIFVKSKEAKERLKPLLSEGNRNKTMQAPVCAIVGYDLEFYEQLPKLFPHTDARSWFVGQDGKIKVNAFRNGTLQGAYPILAARAGPRYRADVGFRQRQRGQGIFRRHQRQVEFPVQSRLRRLGGRNAAFAAVYVRRNGKDRMKPPRRAGLGGWKIRRVLRIGWRP
jgi:3-hydroxypropanoate dehydrogenase